jgi:hypothetical protein
MFTAKGSGPVVQAETRSLHLENPYFERGPIHDANMFFGRTADLDFLFSRLTLMQSVSLVGERRVGKSSLLLELQRSAAVRLDEEYRLVYMDLQGITTMDEFYEKLSCQLGRAGRSHRDLEEAIRGRKVVACLDEFEKVCGNPAFTKDFFDVLRSLAQTQHLALIVASQRTLVELQKTGSIESSPFYNIFTTWTMGDFTRDEARDLATLPAQRAGVPFDDCEVDFVLETAGLHPYRLTVLCYHLFEAKRHGLDDLEGVRAGYEREVDLHGVHASHEVREDPNACARVCATTEPVDAARNRADVLFVLACVFLILGLVSCVVLWWKFVRPRNYDVVFLTGDSRPGMELNISYPTYVAVGNEGRVDVTLSNDGVRSLTQTIVLVFGGPCTAQPLPTGSNVLKFERVEAGGQHTESMSFAVSEVPEAIHHGSVSFVVRVDSMQSGRTYRIGLMPFPYLNTWLPRVTAALVATLLGALGGLFRDNIKQLVVRA